MFYSNMVHTDALPPISEDQKTALLFQGGELHFHVSSRERICCMTFPLAIRVAVTLASVGGEANVVRAVQSVKVWSWDGFSQVVGDQDI